MKLNSIKLLIGFLSVAVCTTTLLADATEAPPPTPAADDAAATAESAAVTSPQAERPADRGVDSALHPAEADSDAGGVTFRAPKRPSQLKQILVDETGPAEVVHDVDSPAAASPPQHGEDVAPVEVAPEQLPAEDGTGPAQVPQEVTPHIGTMSFNGVEPGKTTLTDMKKEWGEPETASIDGPTGLLTFVIPPFKQIDVTTQDELVTSIVVYLDPPMLPGSVANELKLREFDPVPIPDETGQLLGQVYPERGVLFGFAANTKLPQVSQIVVEPITGEPFVLRALYDFQHRYSANLEDLDFALSLDENDAQAHWVKSRILVQIGRYDEALTEAEAAARLDTSVTAYVLQRARTLGMAGRHDEAIKLLESIPSPTDLPEQEKAQVASVMGGLLASSSTPDHKAAVEHYQAAIELASPLVSDRRFEIRRLAKQALVDANAGIGLSVAMGNYQRKAEVAAKWFGRAEVYAQQYMVGDNGPKDLMLEISGLQLAAFADIGGDVDPAQATDAAIQAGRQLIAWSDDPLFKTRVEWLLGTALMDAVRVEHVRGHHLEALRYAELAVGPLESAAAQRQLSPGEQFALGRFYFLAGAVHAVKKQDHEEAAKWYAKAVPLMTSPVAIPTDSLASGRLGEWLVSVGVTYWETNDKQKSLEMTERGSDLIKQAVSEGVMKAPALAVPYANLASMHRALGNGVEAASYSSLAKKMKAPNETQLR
jgi:tetratricopeptide (TPR) repeat protein